MRTRVEGRPSERAVEADVVWGEEPSASFARLPMGKSRAGSRKVRGTFSLTRELFEQVRDAVFHLSGPPLRLTMASLAEGALRRELDRLKVLHNRGRDFPRRAGELQGGRPLGT